MADLSLLLDQTSRTFALAIPLLPEPLRQQVTVAYLLFRTADSLEDATLWSRDARVQALQSLEQVLCEPDLNRATKLAREWLEHPPLVHAGYLALLQEFPGLLRANNQLSQAACETITSHTLRTVAGMIEFARRNERSDRLRLNTLSELHAYCYAVAGIVGEMLTELFLLECPTLARVADELRGRAVRFGEGLQLVNILKDAKADVREKRFLLPPDVPLEVVLEIAREDLLSSQEYIDALRVGNAPDGVIRFTALPVLLAGATLTGVEVRGSGAKISRAEVARIVEPLDLLVRGNQRRVADDARIDRRLDLAVGEHLAFDRRIVMDERDAQAVVELRPHHRDGGGNLRAPRGDGSLHFLLGLAKFIHVVNTSRQQQFGSDICVVER